jgi:protocatechuate 3,4-dioxygenase beta subunit
MSNKSRRSFLKVGLIGGASAALSGLANAAGQLRPTPDEVAGPFYPIFPQKDRDFDLTRIEGKSGLAKGVVIQIEGRVLDTAGKPVEDATVELWQANAAGRYRHPHDPNKAPLDSSFQGWAIVASGKEGQFRFKTVLPGPYPASDTWMRPPHIHFKITKLGYVELITQMYFPGERLNETDLLLIRKSKVEQELMIATLIEKEPLRYGYNVVLQNIEDSSG